MKTDEILYLDCTKQENVQKLNKMLYKIKPIAKKAGCGIVPVETLEDALKGICKRYDYRIQYIYPYYEDGVFVMYTISIIKKENDSNKWKGSLTSKTIWELLAKSIVKIYAEVMKERK